MKINKSVQNEVYERVKIWVDSNYEEIDRHLNEMKNAETVEDFMRAKKELMLNQCNLPLGITRCYFCMEYELNCYICEYGKIHGKCEDDNIVSDYRELLIAERELKRCIDSYFKNRENYDGN